ncbi:MAG: hypothetical protein ACQEP7_02005 [bacterium]
MKTKNQKYSENKLYYNPDRGEFTSRGNLLFEITLGGNTITSCCLRGGNNHRGIEKILETKRYNQAYPWLVKCDDRAGEINNLAFSLAVETLLDLKIPDRVSWIRTVISELYRISSHFNWLNFIAKNLEEYFTAGRTEKIICRIESLLQKLKGRRGSCNFIRVGGLRENISSNFLSDCSHLIKYCDKQLNPIKKDFLNSDIFTARSRSLGEISLEKALDLGITGPALRACGVEHDMRKTDPYCSYEELEFAVPVGENGDVHDRCLIRFEEINQSLNIMKQSLQEISPAGAWQENSGKINIPSKEKSNSSTEALIHHYKLCREGFKIPAGEIYQPVESPRGELAFFIVAGGDNKPHRLHIRPPSLAATRGAIELIPGNTPEDAALIVDSFDINSGEVNR